MESNAYEYITLFQEKIPRKVSMVTKILGPMIRSQAFFCLNWRLISRWPRERGRIKLTLTLGVRRITRRCDFHSRHRVNIMEGTLWCHGNGTPL